jgi:hypothetical protein
VDPPSAGGAVWLWLEHVEDAFGGRWPLGQYGIAARHLGRFNGTFARSGAARPFPRREWFSYEWAESHAEPARLPDARQELSVLLAHPHVCAALPLETRERVRRLLDDQPYFLDVLGALTRKTQTLCHHDAASANLFARRPHPRGLSEGAEGESPDAWETVAIDWEEIGPGPVGAEVATLVFGSMRRRAFPAQRASELEQTVLAQYECGLRDAGWRGGAELMRLGYTAAVALRWFVAPGTLRLLVDTQTRTEIASAAGMPEEEFLQERLALLHFALDCADGAHRLARAASP